MLVKRPRNWEDAVRERGAAVRRDDADRDAAGAHPRALQRRSDDAGTPRGSQGGRERGPRLVCHDAEDREAIVDLGRTPEHGYPVEVHRLVAESDLTVYVNARYNRGFNGGWKSVCVGLSTYHSIKVTHTPDGMSMS